MQDYLLDVKSNQIVEGDKKKKDLESIWTFVLKEGKWKLTLIEESSVSLQYAGMKNDIEAAEEYIRTGYKYKSVKNDNEANI